MTGGEQDILLDIVDEDLLQLAQMYEKHKDWLPHVYSTITNGIEWRKKGKGQYMKFMSPNGCWKGDGTFIVLACYRTFDIFVHSLDDSGKSIYEGIIKTKRLDPGDYKDRLPLLYSIHNKFYPTVIKALKDKGLKIHAEIPCNMESIPREDALKYEIIIPEEVYIKRLEPIHAKQVNSGWPHRFKDSDKAIALLLEVTEGYGVFLKFNDELVSWALTSMLGQMSLVQTEQAHKKKGYGSLIVKYFSKKLSEKGHSPFGTVLVQNEPSMKMFGKLGFRNLGICTYALFE